MRTSTEIWVWIASILIPSIILGVAMLLLRKGHTTSSPPGAPPPDPHTIAPPTPPPSNVACGAEPFVCNVTDPLQTCTQHCGDGWRCTQVETNDTDFGVEGSFCLPTKPTTACTQLPTDSNERMQGVWRWTGWAGVNVQNWECACPYPAFYPMDMGTGTSAGACKKSSSLCRGGTWTYPCKRNPEDPAEITCELSTEEKNALQGADVLTHGQCACEDGDRVALDGGLPVCVPDTCAVLPRCDDDTPCPGGASCGTDGTCVRASSSCATDEECGKSGRCGDDGSCTWGHWKPAPVVPYVFGECECPDGCASVGSFCTC